MEDQADYITDVKELMGWNEPKQVITEFSGFVMIYDCILQRYGNLTKAAVHGAMLRFCGMKDGVCKASLTTIGEMIGVDKATVMRYAKELCDDGYFIDLTPDLRNKPHVYADTGVVQIKNKFSVAQNNVSVAGNNATVAQNQLTKDSNKDKKTLDQRKAEAKERIAKQRAERAGRDPVLEQLKAAQEAAPANEMRVRVENALHRNLDWDSVRSPWNGHDKQLVEREKETGESIEKFMEWFNSDDFRRKGVIYLTPTKIDDWWQQAFLVKDEWSWEVKPHAL